MGLGQGETTLASVLIYQTFAIIVLILIPFIWIYILVRGIYDIVQRPADAKLLARKTAFSLWEVLATPFSISAENSVWVAGRIKETTVRLSSRESRSGGSRWSSSTELASEDESDLGSDDDTGGLVGAKRIYRYERLHREGDVRLLLVYPGDFHDPLRGEVVTVNLTSLLRPAYDALSYTWADESGDGTRSGSFYCGEDGAVIPITKNCEAAIRRLRLRDQRRRVWIDAICINQKSNRDRTQQISLMSRIYMSARQVVVYAGEATDRTNLLFDWLNGLRSEDLLPPSRCPYDKRSSQVFADVQYYMDIGRERLSSLASSHRDRSPAVSLSQVALIELIKEFASRRWFRRVWVLQEVALPDVRHTILVCGNKTTAASRALHALSLLHSDPRISPTMVRIFVLIRNRTRASKKPHLLDLLIEARDREASDPRDKIFALLSIAQCLDRQQFWQMKADYRHTTAHVFSHFSAFFIQQHGAGFFLALIKSRPRISGLPSWAADWTVPWPNNKALAKRDFVATCRETVAEGGSVDFHVYDWAKNGYGIMVLTRPRIIRGYFTRFGHLDGAQAISTEKVEDLGCDEILIEMQPGLCALLRKVEDYHEFVQVCPHALTGGGVEEVVSRWSSVVVDGEVPRDHSAFRANPGQPAYLTSREKFTIR